MDKIMQWINTKWLIIKNPNTIYQSVFITSSSKKMLVQKSAIIGRMKEEAIWRQLS